MPYDRILKANMIPSCVCVLFLFDSDQIFSEIKMLIKNRQKKEMYTALQ